MLKMLNLVALTVIALAACNNSAMKPGAITGDITVSENGDLIAVDKLDYATMKKTIFEPYCVRCHGDRGGVNLETYANVKANLAAVENEAVTNQSMPPRNPLPADLRTSLKSWIKAGAPEKTAVPLSEEMAEL